MRSRWVPRSVKHQHPAKRARPDREPPAISHNPSNPTIRLPAVPGSPPDANDSRTSGGTTSPARRLRSRASMAALVTSVRLASRLTGHPDGRTILTASIYEGSQWHDSHQSPERRTILGMFTAPRVLGRSRPRHGQVTGSFTLSLMPSDPAPRFGTSGGCPSAVGGSDWFRPSGTQTCVSDSAGRRAAASAHSDCSPDRGS